MCIDCQARGTAGAVKPLTMADVHPEWESCDSCGRSLMKCEWCGRYADEHAPTSCRDENGDGYSFDRQETWYVLIAEATRRDPAEYDRVCERCAPSEDEDGPDYDDLDD